MALPPHFQKLLERCHDMQLSHLRPLVDRMFENADIALLDFAEKAESNMAQSVFFEAMNEVRKKRKAIENHFFSELKRSYAKFPTDPEDHKTPTDSEDVLSNLSLVETDEMETSVATLNATAKLTNRIMDRIFALKQRMSVVNGGDAIEENQIPGGPTWLGAAFQRSVEQLELQNKVRLVFIVLFDKYVLSQAIPMFDEYNKRLIMADILPNLRYEVRKQPGGVEIVRKTTENPLEDEAPVEDSLEPLQDQTPSELGDELFGRICDLMSGRQSGGASAGGSSGNVRPIQGSPNAGGGQGSAAGSAQLISQMSTVQSGIRSQTTNVSSSEFIENIEIDQNFIDRLQNTLVEERERIYGSMDRRQIPEADNNVIELVGMLFEYMLKEDAVPNLVKALLSRLHTPLLKVAVLDRQFFVKTKHPARKLLNDMTSAGIRWVDESQVDRSVFPKMKEIVDKILLDFDHDVTIFETLAQEFENHINELRQRAELIEKRTSEAANGQDKLLAARSSAQEEIKQLQSGKPIGASAHEFLQRLWSDKLTFILLRNPDATDSEEWQQATELASQIINSCLPAATEQQREKRLLKLDSLQQELRISTKNLQQADREKLLMALFNRQKQVLETIDPEYTAQVIAAEPEPAIESDLESRPALPELSASQVEMIEKLKSIPFGTWFEFTDDSENKQRAKLSWRSTVTEKFMFVDQMGVKAAVISMQELADNMINGKVKTLSVDKKPFVDRALGAIHKMLDRGTRKTASA